MDEIFDRDAVVNRVGGDMELLRELVGLFADDCPHQVAAVREALERQDLRAIERSAHTIKGVVSNFAARAAFDAAQRVESLGRKGELLQAREAFHVLLHELERLNAALSTFC
jgi:HPt (histidine-containing phosphotransfer) domain-containing protein